MLIDTHAHVNFKPFKEDGDAVVKRALENNVWLINVGAEFDTSRRAVEYAQRYPRGVFAAIGLHPIHIQDQEFSYEKYKELVLKEKVVAIGEIGLDYAVFTRERRERLQKRASAEAESGGGLQNESDIKKKQKEVFLKQLVFAQEFKKPVIIHCRDSHRDTIDILSANLSLLSSPAGVIHSFSGNYKQARKYREMGFKIAFNGIITFARDYDKVILDTPLEDIVLETDCPYLTPLPYRGQRNEPFYVIEVAKKLAEIKNLSLEEVAGQTTANAKKVFNLL